MWQDTKNKFFEEKLTWVLVLRRAAFDYVLYRGVGAHSIDWKRANQYIFGSCKHEEGLSFNEVCEMLEWEPDYIRRLITKLTREDVRKLESGRLRDEFSIETMESIVKNNMRWAATRSAVQFFPPMNMSKNHIKALTLHTIPWREFFKPLPVVQWSVAQ